jgi:hypothetical protein
MTIQKQNIKTKIKQFDKNSYDLHDPQKYKAIEYFNKKKFTAIVHPNKHAVDLIVTDTDQNTFYCEIEVKNNWKGKKFPFNDIQVLYKKKKHFTLDKPSMLMMFNYERTHALILHDKDILQCDVKEIPNKFNREGEYFFIVPVEKATFVEV